MLDGLVKIAPSPRSQVARERVVKPSESKMSGFVFKIQANMDPKLRDRIAFVRLCSGRYHRGMKLHHVRSGKKLKIQNAQLFLASSREIADEAWAGDIIGIPNHGNLRIGDTLTEGEALRFQGIPVFAPELLQKVRPEDPMRAKHLGRALFQLAEEGAARVMKPLVGGDFVVGVVGILQFEILAERVRTEYDVPVCFEPTELYTARWVEGDEPLMVKQFCDSNRPAMAEDHDRSPVFLARNAWHMSKAEEDWPNLRFRATKEQAL